MSQTNAMPLFVNKMMIFFLRSPFHRILSRSILLIAFNGRKSGKTYTTPIGYSEHDGQLYAFTHAGWWKNLCGGAPVTLHLRGHELNGFAEPVEDKEAIAAGLMAHLQMVPSNAKYYRVSVEPGYGPRPGDVDRAAQETVMIRMRTKNSQHQTGV